HAGPPSPVHCATRLTYFLSKTARSILLMEIAIVVILILLHGFLVLGEIALLTAKRSRLEGEKLKGNQKAAIAVDLLDHIDRYLSATQIGITLTSIVVGAYAGLAIGHQLEPLFASIPAVAPYAESISISVVVLLIAYFLLIVGELAPKYIAIQHAEALAIAFAPTMHFITKFTGPIASFLSWSTRLFMRMLFIKPNDQQRISEDEIKLMVKMANQQGVLEEKESEFITNILRFADRDAYTIMTHRNEVVWVDIQADAQENDRIIRESGYTKFLLCDDNIENILGVLKLRDYIDKRDKTNFDLRKIASQPLYIPETMNALKILERFRLERNYFAVVVDEYGSTQGIITLHDLTENIFGTLPDLDDPEEPDIVTREDGSLLVDGMIPMDELRETLHLKAFDFEEADYSTLAGFILYKLSEVPKVGYVLETEGYRFEIVDMDKSKIDRVLISALVEQD
ncbi:MAG: hemolysin family protein, partial [Saprospiraceae bacterium]|nr:hemolysin family protein [Saprospiraceae bacterium]